MKAKSNKTAQINKWLPVFLWGAIIFLFSSMGQTKVGQFFWSDFIVKKAAHLTEYAILFALIYRATEKKWVLSYILVLLFAASDEYHQSFVPGRTPRLYDVFGFDLSGANIGAYIIWKYQQIRQKKHKK